MLQSTAQNVISVEEIPMIVDPQPDGEHLVVYPSYPEDEVVLEMHDPDTEFSLTELPGVEALDPELEAALEVVDEEEVLKADDSEKKSKKAPKWDWESKGAEGFVDWIKERLQDVPSHSGYDSAGIERAISYMEKLDNEISKAMRLDLDGQLDANKIEEVRELIEDGIDRLGERLQKINKKTKKKKRAEVLNSLIKEGQKSTKIDGIVITVPLLISRIARVCINGMVSAGHDIEDMFSRQCETYKLNDREKAECMQLLADMGYPMRQDRGYLAGEPVDPSSSNNFDWATNYQG